MALVIDRATLRDVDELMRLYFLVYGNAYPLALGTDREVMAKTIGSFDDIWLVTRDTNKDRIVGSIVFATDRANRIGKVQALVVDPECQGQGVAQGLISHGSEKLLKGEGALNSVYTTTRTNSVAIQRIFLKNGYLPLGIFPNAHKLKGHETLTLFGKFRAGVLEKRDIVPVVPEKLSPILQVQAAHLGVKPALDVVHGRRAAACAITDEGAEFEAIFAPEYVKRRFYEAFADAYDRFYPFHVPNLLLSSTTGYGEIYAFLSKEDQYCTIVSLTKSVHDLAPALPALLSKLCECGASYIETLMGLEHTESLEALLEAQFLPSAVYPAMQERGGSMRDFVLMSRTMYPLNFKGMEIAAPFKPYVDQYVDLWKKMHLDTLEIFNEYR